METEKKATHKVQFSKDRGDTWVSVEVCTPEHTVYVGEDGFRYISWDDKKGNE